MRKLWAVGLVLLLVAGGLGVLVYARQAEPRITAAPEPATPRRVAAPPTLVPQAKETPRETEYLGVVVADQTVDVAANLEGRLADVLVRVGDEVERGAPVAYLDLRTLESDLALARASYKAARAEEAKARLEVTDAETRLKRAVKLGSFSPAADLETAQSERKLASTRLDSARAGVAEAQARIAKLEVSRTDASVRAPFTGVVAARYLDPGALVHAQTPIIRLISAAALRVRFAVPEDEARTLKLGKGITARLPALGTELRGTIETVAPEVDPAARMIFVEAKLQVPTAAAARPATGLLARVTPDD